MKYYKVTNNNLQSCIYTNFKVQYKIGEFVSAPKMDGIQSRLFVFNSLKEAQVFANKNTGQRIFECEVIDPIEITLMSTDPMEDMDFWIEFNGGHLEECWFQPIPYECYAAMEVKLLKEIKINENKKP